MKEFPVLDNFGALWSTTWQLCSENNLNDLGDINQIHQFPLKFG